MEFNQKLQELRKQKGLTQEELAESLYVSRTAISKWESGRGYPNIESLKAIAKLFSITIDELLSSDELITIAYEENKEKERRFRDFVFGLLDISIAMLFFLPLFASKTTEITSCSLLTLEGVQPYIKIAYFSVVIALFLIGILILALQNCQTKFWIKNKNKISLLFSTIAVLVFAVSLQPYATIFSFVLLSIKTFLLIKRK